MTDRIPVLDHGYVRLVDHMGSDLSVLNAARVSFDKESGSLSERDVKVINFLGREGHTSPFRHATLTIEVYAPLMVARQWWKYVVGSDHTMDGWNESSRRYITETPTFYEPEKWRSAPANKKQGSGGPLPAVIEQGLTNRLREHVAKSVELYEAAIGLGTAVEQARLFLPAYGLYVRWRWTASLQSVCHFLAQRMGDDAQAEIREYSEAVYSLVKPLFPHAVDAYLAGPSG